MRDRIIGLLFVFAMLSCKKDAPQPNPTIENVPHIDFISVNKTAVTEFVDSLVFTIQYQDGNGDLGYENADSTSLELIDNRVPLVEKYHIGLLAPIGAGVTIQGQLNVVLEHTAILADSVNSETTTYSIRMKDRSGSWSNTVVSPVITISN